MERSKPSVYDFLNYREYMRSMIQFLKLERAFTSRDFARTAGFGSSGYLSMVLNEKRNLSSDAAERTGLALGLKSKELEFFCHLVAFNQASSTEEKAETYKSLLRFRSFDAHKPMAIEQYRFFSQWYMPVLYEALAQPMSLPRILPLGESLELTTYEIERALNTMTELGLLKKHKGKYHRTQGRIETIPGLGNIHLFTYHKQMIERSLMALERIAPSQRQFDGLTLAVNSTQADEIRSKIFEFIKELNATYSDAKGADRVIQINLALFPMLEMNKKGSVA